MTVAQDVLCISDSRGRAVGQPVALEAEFYEIGNDGMRHAGASPFVSLPGSGVSPLHARIRRQRDSGLWELEVVSHAFTQLGEEALGEGTRRVLEHGRDLWIGNSHLQLIYADLNAQVDSGSGRLSDLEQRLSLGLLEYEERNRRLFEGKDAAEREGILSTEIDRLIAVELEALSARTIRVYCKEALRRLLISRCLTSGVPGDVPLQYSRLNSDQQRRSQSIRQSYIAALGLRIVPGETEADIARIKAGMAAAHETLGAGIEEYMQRLLIRDALRESVLGLIFRLGPIQFLLDIPNINEIMVSGHRRIFVEKAGRMFDTGLPLASERELVRIAEVIASRDGKSLTQRDTMVDARLPDGSRANIVLAPTARQGTALTIRKFAASPYALTDLAARDMLTDPMSQFLRACVLGRRNILISGGTGSGKTTMLNALAQFVPDHERVVTIEDTAELDLPIANLVSLEGRPANAEGIGEISIQALMRNALRMRPDRIIVGECRGPETLDMLQAMNTGHDGSMTTA
ncbi:MAG: ATPase, T2SS/T4P/T4SS family, partial [Pseudomonadota bacterium]